MYTHVSKHMTNAPKPWPSFQSQAVRNVYLLSALNLNHAPIAHAHPWIRSRNSNLSRQTQRPLKFNLPVQKLQANASAHSLSLIYMLYGGEQEKKRFKSVYYYSRKLTPARQFSFIERTVCPWLRLTVCV